MDDITYSVGSITVASGRFVIEERLTVSETVYHRQTPAESPNGY